MLFINKVVIVVVIVVVVAVVGHHVFAGIGNMFGTYLAKAVNQ
jgi:hypothetical protein